MRTMIKWELFVLVCCLHRSLSEYVTLTVSNYTEARVMCNDIGGKLPLPTDEDENVQIAAYMKSTGLNKTWLDAKLIRTPWHARSGGNIVFIYDQGCHTYPPQAVGAGRVDDHSDCTELCAGRSYMFAAVRLVQVQPPSHGLLCSCFNSSQFLPILPDYRCDGYCSYQHGCGSGFWYFMHQWKWSYRVLSTQSVDWTPTWSYRVLSKKIDYYMVTRPWYPEEERQEKLCASVNAGGEYQLQEYCHSLFHSMCCIGSEVQVLPSKTWFEANYNCSSKGGFIVPHRDGCPRNNQKQDGYGKMWSDLYAWMWEIKGRNDPKEHKYTKWGSAEPIFRRGECIVLTAGRLWETAECTQHSNVICVLGSEGSTVSVDDATTSVVISTIASTASSGNHTSDQSISSTNKSIGIALDAVVADVIVIAVVVVIIICLKRMKTEPPMNTPNHHTNAIYLVEDDVKIGDGIKKGRQGEGKVNAYMDTKDNSVYVSSDASDHTALSRDPHEDRHYEVVQGVDGKQDGTLVMENDLYTNKDLADPDL